MKLMIYRQFAVIGLLVVALSSIAAGITNDVAGLVPEEARDTLHTNTACVNLQFDDTDIRTVLLYLSELSGENIIYGSDVRGTVTCITPAPLTPEQAIAVLHGLLESQGLTLITLSNATKVVRAGLAARKPIPLSQSPAATAPR